MIDLIKDLRTETHSRMEPIAAMARQVEFPFEWSQIYASDNLGSSVTIRGSSEKKENWENGIFKNSRYVLAMIHPARGARYYDVDEHPKVTIEVVSHGFQFDARRKFRKYTGTPEKCLRRLDDWIASQIQHDQYGT